MPTALPLLETLPLFTEKQRRLHVVLVDEELPYPPISGKRIRTLNLTLRLAKRHRLTYFCHRNADPQEAELAKAFFHEHDIETVVVNRSVPSKSGPMFYARLAANLLSPLPYSVSTHASSELVDAVQRYASTHDVDLWHCEWTPYAHSLRALHNARRVVMAHNVESLIWQRYHETESNTLKRWYIGRQWRKFERFEQRAFAEATRTIAVSSEDADLMRRRFGASRIDVVENGVDTDFFQPVDDSRDPKTILFLGSLEWRPNLDGVKLLLDKVFPAVRSEEPNARLCLVGRNPPDWLRRQVTELAGVELHANVADVRPFLARVGQLAVPLRIGGGSRLKILEALAMRLPVVSTRIGAEGLCLEANRHLSVVESIDEMAAALVRTMRHPLTAARQAEAGRQVVLAHYDWDSLADKMDQVWQNCCSQPAKPV